MSDQSEAKSRTTIAAALIAAAAAVFAALTTYRVGSISRETSRWVADRNLRIEALANYFGQFELLSRARRSDDAVQQYYVAKGRLFPFLDEADRKWLEQDTSAFVDTLGQIPNDPTLRKQFWDHDWPQHRDKLVSAILKNNAN